MNRRSLLRCAGVFLAPAILFLKPGPLRAAAPFWNRKPPAEWTPEEVEQLLSHSPWARETNIDFELTEGGHVELPPGGGAPGQEGKPRDAAGGVMHRAPVTVRWESAQAVRDAAQLPLLQVFANRYVISVSNIPPEVMNYRRRKTDPVSTLAEMLAELQGAATLEIPGREPAGAGLVRRVPGSESNYLFGFEKELLPITGAEKSVDFVLHTARVSVKARFDLKNMLYRGQLAL